MNTVDYYLSKGADRNVAEYFADGRKQISDVVANRDFTLTITFNNGERRRYDMCHLLKQGTVFEFLMKWENFQRVYLDDNHCIAWNIDPHIDSNQVWSNKIDLCPDSCYLGSTPLDK